ncbi:hypothetical protein C2S52_012882 [Perilla frutescens var. hirtella]|nr:hypothetical protein C2S52_012882 [Perilla frutescens var. hirtella]
MPIKFVDVAAPDSLGAALSMSREEWPPQWKPIEESPEWFFMGGYLQTMDFETDPSLYPSHYRLPYADYMTFLKQIRESRGYDITFTAPGSTMHPVPLSSMEDAEYDYFIQLCGYIVEKINDRAEVIVQYTYV